MIAWEKFINALGKEENSSDFLILSRSIGEEAKIFEDPEEYNDPMGKTKYYKFLHSGVEIGFRNNILNHVHFYFDSEDGFSPFRGCLLLGINSESNKQLITQKLGAPVGSGGGKQDMLIGYTNQRVRYQHENYYLHLEFDKFNKLSRSTLMK